MNIIKIIEGDITKCSGCSIVNAANSRMLGGGGVDGAIHRAAGPKLREACHKVTAVDGVRCPVGESRLTPAFDLNFKNIIHTVGPRYKIDAEPEKLLRSCYVESLNVAKMHQCKSIFFPAISCGAYGYPASEAASIALGVCTQPEYNDIEITFVLYDKSTASEWRICYESLILKKYLVS